MSKADKIGIIYSPGYGAGWSTWGEDASALDQELANAIDQRQPINVIQAIAEKNWPGQYQGGLRDAVVMWADLGEKFIINEYDGNESVRLLSDGDLWQTADAKP